MRIIFPILVIFTTVCCKGKVTDISTTIKNETNTNLDSVVVAVDTIKLKFSSIEIKKEFTQTFLRKNIQNGHDDNAFTISIYVRDSLVNSGTFGYFAHGNIAPKYVITIYDNFKFREN